MKITIRLYSLAIILRVGLKEGSIDKELYLELQALYLFHFCKKKKSIETRQLIKDSWIATGSREELR